MSRQSELDRCRRELAAMQDYNQPLAFLNAIGEADWYAEMYLIEQEPMDLNDYAAESHAANIKWWQDPKTGQPIERNFGELIALCHAELSEALEGHRKNLQDEHLPHRKSVEVELADLLIRVFDLAGGLSLDLQGAYEEKTLYNAKRRDHTHEARLEAGGKRY